MNQQIGKYVIIAGGLVVLMGIIIYFFGNKLSFFGRLPGDIRIEKESGSFYFPITTCILISVIISLVVRLIQWLMK
jgi:hypothetical protein